MASKKRDRQFITLKEKKSIIKMSENKMTTARIVKYFDKKYGESTIRGIIKNKDKILEGGFDDNRATLRGAKYSTLENMLLEWLNDYVRGENVVANGSTLRVGYSLQT